MKVMMNTLIGIAAAALLVATPGRVWAQRASSPQDLAGATLEDLLNIRITTATRSSEGAATAPARVQVVTGAQIQRRGYRSLADLLKDLPDFKVDLGGHPQYPTELTVDGNRGVSRVVLLLDGIRISSPTNEPLPILANYPVHSARQVEILYGPASALYGADAFSAVINIISKDAGEASGLSLETSVGQFGLYNQTGSYAAHLGSAATLVVAGQALYDDQPDLSKYYPSDFQGLAAQRSGTFNTIFGPMTPVRAVSAGYEAPLAAHSVHATFRDGPLQVMLFENRSRVSTAAPKTPNNAIYNSDAFNQNTLLVGAASYTKPIGRASSVSTVTFSRHQLDPQSGFRNVNTRMERNYKYAYGSMTKAEEQLSWTLTRSITMTTGGTIERFFSIPQTAGLNAPITSRDEPGTILGTTISDDFVKLRYANTGAFGQMQYAVTPAIALVLGGRVDYNTRFGATLNPRVGVVAKTAQGTTVKILYGKAFLAPSPYEAYSHYGSFFSTDGGHTFKANFWHVPNPDLKPQEKKTVEVNLLQTLGGAFELSASAFYDRFTSLVTLSDNDTHDGGLYLGWPVADIERSMNEGSAATYGGTVGLDFLHALGPDRRIEARAALAYADGSEKDPNSNITLPIGGMAPVQLRFSADADWHRWSVAPRLAIVGRQRLLATTAADSLQRLTLDGYTTLDVNIRRQSVFKNIDGFVTIENALDRRYRGINPGAYINADEMIGVPQNPRRLTVGFDLRLR
jgi:outer membrane cobalamin receptor